MVKRWDNKLQKDKSALGDKVKGKTITVLQSTPKGISAFGQNYGRGTEIVYDGYGMKQPKLLEKKRKTLIWLHHLKNNLQITQEIILS